MTDLTYDQAKQADNHLVTVRISIAPADPVEVTGILSSIYKPEGIEQFAFDLTEGFRPGSYDYSEGDEVLGERRGLMVLSHEIVEFTDHGERSDALTLLAQLEAARAHAQQALKDAEANLARAYTNLTDLTALEG